MKISAYGLTDPGLKRKSNDDSFLIDHELGLYIVCDGVGGHAAGNVASEMCAKAAREHIAQNRAVLNAYKAKPSPSGRAQIAELLRSAIELANAKIFNAAESDPSKRGMSTTADLLLVTTDYAFLGHVGDSRIYLLRSGKTHQLTEDHKVSTEMQKQGLWTAEQASNNPYSHVLTRAVGVQSFVQVDLLQLELMAGDFFLLCSDGLADYFKSEQLSQYVDQHQMNAIPEQLVDFAKKQGGHDNITAVVVRFEGERAHSSDAALDALRKSEILGKVPLFRYLSYAELIKVLDLVKLHSYESGKLLIEEGATSNEMFVLVSGAVEVVKSGHVIAERGRGDFIGEMGLLDNAPRSASVRTSEATTVMAIARKDILNLLRQDSQIAVKFLWALNQEINQRLRLTSQHLAYAKASLEMANRTDIPYPAPHSTNSSLEN